MQNIPKIIYDIFLSFNAKFYHLFTKRLCTINDKNHKYIALDMHILLGYTYLII